MTSAPADSKAPFLNTAEVFPKDPTQLLIKMTSLHTDVANAVNMREISQYQDQQQILTGQQFSIANDPNKKLYSFRKVFYFGAIAAGATLNIPHGIPAGRLNQLTHLYGTCVTVAGDWRPIPFAWGLGVITVQIGIYVTAANIVIGNGATSPNITSGLVVMEYMLN